MFKLWKIRFREKGILEIDTIRDSDPFSGSPAPKRALFAFVNNRLALGKLEAVATDKVAGQAPGLEALPFEDQRPPKRPHRPKPRAVDVGAEPDPAV